jgi:hypothetical protein
MALLAINVSLMLKECAYFSGICSGFVAELPREPGSLRFPPRYRLDDTTGDKR